MNSENEEKEGKRRNFLSPKFLFWFSIVLAISGGFVLYFFFSEQKIKILDAYREYFYKVIDIFPVYTSRLSFVDYLYFESFWLLILVTTMIIGLAFFKDKIYIISYNNRSYPFNSFIVGLIGIIIVVFLNVLFALSIIGIPLILLLNIGLIIALIFGFVSISWNTGDIIIRYFSEKKIPPVFSALLGIILIEIIKSLPYIGWLVYLLVLPIGIGSVLVTRFGTIVHSPGKFGSEG